MEGILYLHLMEPHYHLTDQAFEQQFATAAMPPATFSHEAHIRLAWIHINKYGEPAAIQNITTQLQQYVNKLGAADKYNHTLTIAAVQIVGHFIRKKQIDQFAEFITTYPRLKTNFRDLIDQHYGFDIFQNTKAKAQYAEPDLLPFT